MYLVVLSTLPHFYSIKPLIFYKTYTFEYINIIILSTIFSILYHIYEESNCIINSVDYFFAGLWFICDIYMGYVYTNKKTIFKILLVNMLSIFINTKIPHNKYYKLTHSIWHCINAYKCYYVSKLISMNIANFQK